MELFREEYWSEVPFPSTGDLPDPTFIPRSPELQAASLLLEPPGKPLVQKNLLKNVAIKPRQLN